MQKELQKLKQDLVNNGKKAKGNEALTKSWFIEPLLKNILGYSPFDIIVEADANHGSRAGHKVDYLINKDDKEIMIIEAKSLDENIANSKHYEQLADYFSKASFDEVKFAILTNGDDYYFYSDFNDNKHLDKEPFFTFKVSEFEKYDLNYLSLFSRGNFKYDKIAIRGKILQEIKNPSENMINHFKPSGMRNGSSPYAEFKKNFIEIWNEIFNNFNKNNIENKEAKIIQNNIIKDNGEWIDIFDLSAENFKKIAIRIKNNEMQIKAAKDILRELLNYLYKNNFEKFKEFARSGDKIIKKEKAGFWTESTFLQFKEFKCLYFELHGSTQALIDQSKRIAKFFDFKAGDFLVK